MVVVVVVVVVFLIHAPYGFIECEVKMSRVHIPIYEKTDVGRKQDLDRGTRRDVLSYGVFLPRAARPESAERS